MLDNGDLPAKIEIRQRVLAELTPARAAVFDAFAGAGQMFDAVWHQAASYTGCDEKWDLADRRRCFAADNRRVLRCIDLAPYNCFDLDAYGDPWEAAIIIATRRPKLVAGERLALVVTDGGWVPFSMCGRMGGPMRQASGITADRLRLAALGSTQSQTTAGAREATKLMRIKRFDDLVTSACVHFARSVGGTIVKQWQAVGRHHPVTLGAHMRYRGLVIDARPPENIPKS